MLSVAVVFVVITVCKEAISVPVQRLDLDSILKFRENKYDDEYKNNNFVPLKSQELVNLVQKATDVYAFSGEHSDKREYRAEELLSELNNKHNKRLNKIDKVTFGHYFNSNKDLNKNGLDNEGENEFRYSQFNKQALDELLSKKIVNNKYRSKSKSVDVPSSLIGSNEFMNYRNNDNNEEEYSKIYVILNPEAIEKSENKENLNKLLTRILSLTSSSWDLKEKKRDNKRLYKGFPVKTGLLSRRVRRDSREMYAKDSMDDDYKPKRNRGERGGGGIGVAGGRTAIPYIKNRGDIYERDH
ncbi:hypothetical protein evm_005977 [Chilo suppressalis]|nr:hypothetical protein evm_005977 [Chilo suppressalis]